LLYCGNKHNRKKCLSRLRLWWVIPPSRLFIGQRQRRLTSLLWADAVCQLLTMDAWLYFRTCPPLCALPGDGGALRRVNLFMRLAVHAQLTELITIGDLLVGRI
jgi:hypothetical protein